MSYLNPANFSVIEQTRDGRRLEIRSLRQDDRDEMLAAVGRTSDESLYRRFFGAKRHFSEKEIGFFLNLDFISHVGLVALVEEDGVQRIAGGCRYVVTVPGQAEFAIAIVDAYQGQSIGAALFRNLAFLARAGGLSELIADVLATNVSMLTMLERSGLPVKSRREGQIMHMTVSIR